MESRFTSILQSEKLRSFFRIFGVTIQGEGSIWQSALKDAKRTIGLCLRALPMIVGSSSLGYVKACFVFTRFAVALYRRQGPKGTAKYFKAATLLLMKSTGGDVLVDSMKAGHCVSLTRKGLPRCIPKGHRERIRQGHGIVIHLWLSLFSIYRVLEFKGVPSLSTVTAPGIPITETWKEEWDEFLETHFWFLLYSFTGYGVLNRFSRNLPKVLSVRTDLWAAKWLLLLKGGPNSTWDDELKAPSFNLGNLLVDAWAWVTRPDFFKVLIEFIELTGNSRMLMWAPAFRAAADSEYIRRNAGWVSSYFDTVSGRNHPLLSQRSRREPFGFLGRLAFIPEPGKVRVVAMLDSWTQILLYPLHSVIFDRLLKCIPQDGTFNQYRPIERLLPLIRERGLKRVYSFDLSAATDRLPVLIQEIVLSYLMGSPLASLWRRLLTERLYSAPSKYDGVKTGAPRSGVKYAVGQPMGAYSSWAMLALTHHAIVQFAAWRTGQRSWFSDYALLGDDVVIFHTNVAMAYLNIMREIGVEISFSKSLSSDNGSFEFAKRYICRGVDVSPLTLKHIAVGMSGLKFIPELTSKARQFAHVNIPQVAKFAGLGFKAQSAVFQRNISVGNRFKGLMILLTAPGGPFSVGSLTTWLSLVTVVTAREITQEELKYVFTPCFQSIFKRLVQDGKDVTEDLRKELLRCGLDTIPDDDSWFEVHILKPFLGPIQEHYKRAERYIAELWILGGSADLTMDSMLDLVKKAIDELSLVPKSLFVSAEEVQKMQAGIWIRFWVLFSESLMDMHKPKEPVKDEPYWVRYSKRVRPFPPEMEPDFDKKRRP